MSKLFEEQKASMIVSHASNKSAESAKTAPQTEQTKAHEKTWTFLAFDNDLKCLSKCIKIWKMQSCPNDLKRLSWLTKKR